LQPPSATSDKVALADRWAAAGANRPSLLHPARRLYAEALADTALAGIARAAVEEKAKKLGPEVVRTTNAVASTSSKSTRELPRGRWIDLLALARLPDDAVSGNWTLRDG